MHMGGGIVAGYFGIIFWHIHIWIRKWYEEKRILSVAEILKKGSVFWPAILFALTLGIVWEFLEYVYGLSGLDIIHRADTITDIVNDMTGSIIAIIIWKFSNRNLRK